MEDLILKKGFVSYEDFGAVGDGVADDFTAIYKAHEYANEHKLKVLGTPGKTYYIFDTTLGTGDTAYSATIKTDVDWQGANFIIDDRKLSRVTGDYRHLAAKQIFNVMPEDEHVMFKIEDEAALAKIEAQGINRKTSKIDIGIDWDGPVMIVPYSSAHRVFRRRGYGQYAGAPMHELIVLKPDGTVDPETPIMFDYGKLDYIEVYKLDESSALTIENGVFTTLESKVNHMFDKGDGTLGYKGSYITRGLNVCRSYTTVKNIKHIVEVGFTLRDRLTGVGEGSPYHGFFRASNANRITFKDCVMPGRCAYGVTHHSSYNFGALCVNKIVLDNCFQPNFWVTVDPETFEVKDAAEYAPGEVGNARKTSPDAIPAMGAVALGEARKMMTWGIGGTNYCKNMEYLNSTLSRFDAHAGLYHGKVINCNISGMELTGVGDFIFKDSAWYPYSSKTPLLYLRSDYGWHWDGDILVQNAKSYMHPDSTLYIAHYSYINWYFGYTVKFPNITVDNMTFYNLKDGERIQDVYEAKLFAFKEIMAKMHLDDAGMPSIFALLDEDGDGYIDEPIYDRNRDGVLDPPCDLDGDGKIGNTSLKFADYFDEGDGFTKPTAWKGIEHPTCTVNLNIATPPRYIKVINNKTHDGRCVCRYVMKDTSLEGISDGGWYRGEGEPDTFGGYFGTTKFIYGEGEDDFFIGTKDKNSVSESFAFEEEYFIP
ncbi:MAG: hypothetical protein E7612_00515 [Ruminococcaceae bacterium]|nr:hypothetical protein [Oscillospiraceae bacterium]